jgi:hypothetical protein
MFLSSGQYFSAIGLCSLSWQWSDRLCIWSSTSMSRSALESRWDLYVSELLRFLLLLESYTDHALWQSFSKVNNKWFYAMWFLLRIVSTVYI